MNYGQVTRTMEPRQFVGIPAVRFDVVARTYRRQGGSNDETWVAQACDLTVRLVAARASFIDELNCSPNRDPFDEFRDCRCIILDRCSFSHDVTSSRQDGCNDGLLVDIKPYDRGRIFYSRYLLFCVDRFPPEQPTLY